MNTVTDREYAELRKMLVETDNLIAETRKMQREASKIDAEILKLHAETRWHSFYKVAMWWGSAFAAAAAVIKFSNAFLK